MPCPLRPDHEREQVNRAVTLDRPCLSKKTPLTNRIRSYFARIKAGAS